MSDITAPSARSPADETSPRMNITKTASRDETLALCTQPRACACVQMCPYFSELYFLSQGTNVHPRLAELPWRPVLISGTPDASLRSLVTSDSCHSQLTREGESEGETQTDRPEQMGVVNGKKKLLLFCCLRAFVQVQQVGLLVQRWSSCYS